jgi:hypothetical protein
VKPYARFRDEVSVISKNYDIQGILPILDYFLPNDVNDGPPWYVMPIADSIYEYLHGKYFEDVIRAITAIASRLSERA